jgi:hypothetical protein
MIAAMSKAIIHRAIFPSLLLPYLISLVGMFSTYFAFFHRDSFQVEVRNSDENELKTLSFTPEEFESLVWTDGQKEFERGGKMFDVAKIERQGKNYVIYCENDFLEDVLIAFLKTSGGKSKSKGIAHVQFIEPIPDFKINSISANGHQTNDFQSDLYRFTLLEKSTPPPRLA